jgi:ABC-type multidrug transport system fused ATPase/permease subunit
MKYEVPKKKITLVGLKKLLQLYRYLKPYKLEYGLGLLFLLGSSSASLVFPKLVGELVDYGNQGKLGDEINRIALILVAVLIIQSTCSYFRILLFVRVAEKTLADLRQSAYNHMIRLPMKFFQHRRVGELNSRISSDITLLQDALTSTLAEFLRQVIIIVGGVSLMLVTSFKLTLFMLSILPVIMILVVLFGRYIRKLSKQAQSQVADSNTIVEETLQGIQSVKAFTNEERETTGSIFCIYHSGAFRGHDSRDLERVKPVGIRRTGNRGTFLVRDLFHVHRGDHRWHGGCICKGAEIYRRNRGLNGDLQ